MATTVEELEKRVRELEKEVARLREMVENGQRAETPAEGRARLMGELMADQAALSEGWARAMEAMGIRGEPIGAEKVQEMIAACGFKPEENAFSRGIIEMREE